MRSIGLGVLALSACDPGGGGEVMCTDMAAASVMVTVTDGSGAVVPDVTVAFDADGHAGEACSGDGNTFVCGYEVAGDITVTASAPGFESVEQTVTIAMDSDGCHVVGQSVTLELVTACDDPPPAMIVTVLEPEGEPADGETVSWGRDDTDGIPRACDEEGDGTWVCGYGATGVLDLYVQPGESEPFESYFEVVTVAVGECGPETVFKTVTLSYLAD